MIRATGLRPRLLAAFVLTSAVSLGFAAIALLSPLKDQLRKDSTQTVLAAASATRTVFEDINVDRSGTPNQAQLRRQARSLGARVGGARVVLLDDTLHPVFSNMDPEQQVPVALARRSLLTPKTVHEIQDQVLHVAEPLHINKRRYVLLVLKRLAYVQQSTRVVQDVFLKAAAVGLAVALLLAIGLSGTLLRRLERLRVATRKLDEEGLDAAPPPTDHSRDEIGELTRAFAGMHARLRRQENARRAFVATASHELRTPLASLDGMLELLADDLASEPADIEDARERIARAQEQSRRLASLASDLLDLSRIDAETELRSEPVELAEVARAVAAEFERRAAQRGISLEVIPPSEPCWAEGDPGGIARIVRILLDNALRAAPAGSTVTVKVDTGKRWVALEVRDEGSGVPEEDRDLIFERFQRGSGPGAKGGFGLGLAIGRELATRMGGALELMSHGPGATFQLRLETAPVGAEL
jgi:signal transduction histidine kinase